MNSIKFIQQHGIDKAREIVDGAPETATHFTEALGGHYAKEGMLKMKPQWLWFNSINKEWYYDFAAEDHIHLPDLKRLVESVDLVTAWGGLESTYSKFRYAQEHKNTYAANMIQQAIADCEAIYGGEHV